MAFRQYGGLNYAPKNNIVSNNYSNTDNLTVNGNNTGNTNVSGQLTVNGGLQPRYISGFFNVSTNNNYDINTNLTFNNNTIPMYKILFCVNDPIKNPNDNIYDITGQGFNSYYIYFNVPSQIVIITNGNVAYLPPNMGGGFQNGYYSIYVY